jgi:hypothetical protein
MTASQQLEDLGDLAVAINSAHWQRDAYMCGAMLIQAKGQLRHGQWLAWLETNCKVPERTAREYMKLARSSQEYKGSKPLSRNSASKKAFLSSGMVVTVANKDAPNAGESVEVIRVEGEVVVCKTSNAITPYFISELISSKTKPTSKPKKHSIGQKRVEILEELLEKFVLTAKRSQLPSQALISKAELVLGYR